MDPILLLERAEIEALADLYAAAPPDVVTANGLSVGFDVDVAYRRPNYLWSAAPNIYFGAEARR